MADLNIALKATDQASAAFRSVGAATGQLREHLAKVATAATVAGAGLAALAVNATKAFMEQERAQRQLSGALLQMGYDSGKLTSALSAQADAFEKTLGVQGEMVMSMQALMLRFGVAPRDIKGTTQAVLDFAAATGRDATDATETVLRAIENHGERLSRLGIKITATGDKSKDLAAATEALAKKFGGAAAANADTLQGRINLLGSEVDDLKKSFGGFLAAVETKVGILSTLTFALKEARELLDGGDRARIQRENERARIKEEIRQLESGEKHYRNIEGQPSAVQYLNKLYERLAEIEVQGKAAWAAVNGGAITEGTSPGAGAGRFYTPASAKKAADEAEKDHAKLIAGFDKVAKEYAESLKQQIEGSEEYASIMADFEKKQTEFRMKVIESRNKREAAKLLEGLEHAQKAAEHHRDALLQDLADKQMAIQAGMMVGAAFLDGLASQLQQVKRGGQLDFGQLLLSLLPFAMSFIPGGAQFAPLVGAGVRLAGVALESPERHAVGGWVGGSGSGDTTPALLTPGERVLSLAEIQRMGGPVAVERAAAGRGGGVTNNFISTMDSGSFEGFMGGRGGSGMVRTIRRNSGEFAAVLRRMGAR